jgi:hypothetical protein
MSFKKYLKEAEDKEKEDEVMGSIIEFFSTHEKPDDEEVHKLAEQLGIDKHQFEEKIYELLSSFFDAGKSKTNPPENVDPEQLKKGMEVEKEHSNNPIITRRIALDHISEFPTYYTALEKMEKELKTQSKKD